MKTLLLTIIAATVLASASAQARPLTSVEKLSYTATALTKCKANPENSHKFCYCFAVAVAQEATTEDLAYTQKVGKLSQQQETAISTAYTACSLR
jgi:hypothetical protein